MPQKRKNGKGRKDVMLIEQVSPYEKIARLLGILATKDVEQVPKRVNLLRAVGFSVAEVASLLGMTENHVRVASHLGRKKVVKKKATQRKKH